MLRTIDVILVAIMVAAAALTFKVKHDTELRLEEVRRIEAEIRTEEDTIDVLKADWSVLTQPGRLQTLVETYQSELDLVPLEPDQIAAEGRMPEMLRMMGEIAARRTGEDEAATDGVKTGAVSQ